MSAPPVRYFSALAQPSPRILKFLALASTFLLAVSCGDDGEGGKSGGGKSTPAPSYAYVCPNGTPAGGTTSAPNIIKCNSCGTNYVEENDECFLDSDNDGVANRVDVDDDGDGLIEINDATELGHIKHNLAGTGHKTGPTATDNINGGSLKITSQITSTVVRPAGGTVNGTFNTTQVCIKKLRFQVANTPNLESITITLDGTSIQFLNMTTPPNSPDLHLLTIESQSPPVVKIVAAINGDTTQIVTRTRALSDFNVQGLCGYELNADVAVPNSWTPIGTNSARFTGIFEGNNKTVSNLVGTTGSERRLFNHISSVATVRNIKLGGIDITNDNSTDIAVDNINGGTVTGIVVAP